MADSYEAHMNGIYMRMVIHQKIEKNIGGLLKSVEYFKDLEAENSKFNNGFVFEYLHSKNGLRMTIIIVLEYLLMMFSHDIIFWTPSSFESFGDFFPIFL